MEQIQGSLMVVAILIAKLTFQVGTNPPTGVWQTNSNRTPIGPKIFTSILSTYNHKKYAYEMLVAFYTIAFLASLKVILYIIVMWNSLP